MRIADNMQTYSFLRSLNKSQQRENSIQEQLSDGKTIHRPSDDPIKAVRSLRYNTSSSTNTQYTRNLQDAQSWMNSTDGAMSSLSSIMIKANELVISADDTKTPDELATIGKQIDEMVNQIVQIGNTKVGSRYIFGGQNDSTAPFTRITVKDPNSDATQEVVAYSGDDSKISMKIQSGATNANQDSVNLTGADVFGPVTNVYGTQTVSALNRLLDIKSELQKTSTVSQTNTAGGIGSVTGTYTGEGFTNFNVRIDQVDGGAATGIGHVTGASYSTDGGNTWTNLAAADVNTTSNTAVSASATTLTLPSGISFTITDSAKNTPYYTDAASTVINQTTTAGVVTAGTAHADVYTFRVPQTAASITQSNTTGGAAVLAGTYSGTGSTAYSVRITSTDATGQVTGAEYSTDKGASWATVGASGTTTAITAGSPSVITLTNGVKLNIAASSGTTTDDTYSFWVPQGKGGDAKWLSGVATNYVQDDHSMQLKAQTKLGTRMSMYEMASNIMTNQGQIIQTDLSNNESIDMAQAITDFTTSQTVYKSALSVGAKIMSKSLVDFIS